MLISVNHLTYIYSERSKGLAVKAIDDVSLTIEEGDFFGIIGHTGSGKSTFVQHLNGLIRLEKGKGEIKIGDFDLSDKKCDFKALRSKVGMVFQYPEYQLFAETVFEDVAFGLKNFNKNLSAKETEDSVKEAIEKVNLNYEEVKEKSPFELSGGEKRRVALAGVLVTKPEILILDEPAAGLDPQGREELIKLLNSLHENSVKTIIIISHDMDLIADNCNKVGVLSKGKLVKLGTPEEVFDDTVESLGLDLPLTAYLKRELKKKGVELNCKLKRKDFISAIVKIKGGNK